MVSMDMIDGLAHPHQDGGLYHRPYRATIGKNSRNGTRG
jgi:hypothetical protein